MVSYAIAGLSAMFSGLCYSEFGTEYPVAGGSFVFILYTFGEFWSWITATNIIFNYSTLSGPLLQTPCLLLLAPAEPPSTPHYAASPHSMHHNEQAGTLRPLSMLAAHVLVSWSEAVRGFG